MTFIPVSALKHHISLLIFRFIIQFRAIFITFNLNILYNTSTLTTVVTMPTIVTELVNDMFRSRKRDFVKKLRDMPVASTDR